MRKPAGTAAILLALVLALGAVACGSADSTADGGTEAATEPGEQEASYPVVIEHATGSTTIEERPERIVTLSVQWTDAVLAMGVEPVAYVLDQASQETEPYPWHADQVADATRIDTNGTIPFEQIAALQPDLILVTHLASEPEVMDTLQGLAPAIGLLGDRQVDLWQDQVDVMGRVLGEPERADQVIAEVDGKVTELAEELPGLEGKTYVAANYAPGDGIYVVADPDDGASQLFYQLGMEIDPDILALDERAVGRVQISTEQVELLDADFIGILTNGVDPAELPGWNQLPAVRSDAMIDFELPDIVGLNTPTPLSVPYVADLMRPALETVASTS